MPVTYVSLEYLSIFTAFSTVANKEGDLFSSEMRASLKSRVPEHTSQFLPNREETNANGGPKWRQILKFLKNHKKFAQKRSYTIGVILLLLFCMCFPFMYRSDKNTSFVNCIYSVFTSWFSGYKHAIQQASQIRQASFKISPNKFRSIGPLQLSHHVTYFS